MNKYSFLVHLLLVALCQDGLQATGCFFQKYKGDENRRTSPGLPHFDPELFRCGHSSDCLYLGRKGGKFKSISQETNADFINSFDEVWKKMEIIEMSGTTSLESDEITQTTKTLTGVKNVGIRDENELSAK